MACNLESEARSYRPGDVIIKDCDPLIKMLKPDLRQTHCSNCFEENLKLLPCNKCKQVKYCNKTCQKNDWKNGHKIECASMYFKQIMPNKESCLIAFRLYAQLKVDPSLFNKQFDFHDGTKLCLQDLIDANNQRLNKEFILNSANEITKEINRLDSYAVDIQEILLVLNIMYYHTFHKIYCKNGFKHIGFGFYLPYSAFKHACNPTAVCKVSHMKLQIRSINEIGKEEQPRVSFSDEYYIMDKKDMRRYLLHTRGFICNCSLCLPGRFDEVDFKSLDGKVSDMQNDINWSKVCYMNWRWFYPKHVELVAELRELYCKYDVRVTEQIRIAVLIGINLKVSPSELRELYDQARKNLQVTFGEDSNNFKTFIRNTKHYFNE